MNGLLLSGAAHAQGGWAVLGLSILPPLPVVMALPSWQRSGAAGAWSRPHTGPHCR
jgi:hypothetical protein